MVGLLSPELGAGVNSELAAEGLLGGNASFLFYIIVVAVILKLNIIIGLLCCLLTAFKKSWPCAPQVLLVLQTTREMRPLGTIGEIVEELRKNM